MFLQTAWMNETPDREVNFLKAWREFRGLSQEQLATEIGTTGPVISLLESGARSLSPKWLRRIAPALKTTPGYLLDHHPDDIDNDVFDLWSQIPRENREQALKVLAAFSRAS